MITRVLFRIGAVAAALGLPLFAATDSFANDAKYYHGTECVERGADPEVVYGPGGIQNTDTTARYILCPVVRDITDSDVADWDVAVDRHGSTDAWTVRLYSCDYSGTTCTSAVVTVPPGGGVITIDGAAFTGLVPRGPMYLMSLVPAGSLIRAYHVNEKPGTE